MFFRRRVVAAWMRAAVPVAFLGALFLYALWPWLPVHRATRAPVNLVFYGFSILEESIAHAVFPDFQKQWRERTGQRITLTTAFAGSGTVTNQILSGAPADLVLLSHEADALRLAEAGVVRPNAWHALPHRAVVNRSPLVLLVRPGNPKGIRDFSDLARPGVEIVHPDPLTSGAAMWSVVAEFGVGRRTHPENPGAGHDLLLGIWRNVVAQAASARAARSQFENGFGDALVTYEQEALLDRARGRLHADVVVPPRTILTEHVLVEIPQNVTAEERPAVDAFVAYLWSDPGQHRFVEHGFRSVNETLNRQNPAFVRIPDAFRIQDLGGWASARDEIVELAWKRRVLPELGR